MKKILVILLLSVCALQYDAAAQSIADNFSKSIAGKCLSFKYHFESRTNLNMTGSGQVWVQDGKFKVVGSGMVIFCDGNSVWTIDSEAKEAIVETAADGSALLSNPAYIVSSFGSAFKTDSQKMKTVSGKQYNVVSLTPAVDSDIRNVEVSFAGTKEYPVLSSTKVTLKNGTVTDFVITESVTATLKDNSFFKPEKFGSDWVVTDLRD